MYLNISQDFI